MKKHGFTLAEVLITLGIIGVVSALVIPTFTAQTQSAKIGPRVGKAIASFEQATKAMLEDAGADTLSGATVKVDGNDYQLATSTTANLNSFMQALSTHMKGAPDSDTGATSFISADGFKYSVGKNSDLGTIASGSNNPSHNQYIAKLMIDINGANEPNKDARDRFYFAVMDDGSLIAFGSKGQKYSGLAIAREQSWEAVCAANSKPTDAKYCAGHIVENGMKALYK